MCIIFQYTVYLGICIIFWNIEDRNLAKLVPGNKLHDGTFNPSTQLTQLK